MPEMHLRQPGFKYSACGPFTKKQRKNPKIQRNRRFTIHLSKWTRQDLLDFKNLTRRTANC